MLSLVGTQDFMRKLKRDNVNLRGKVTRAHQNIIRAIFTDLVTLSPQWSGNLASNWFIEFHGMKASYRPIKDASVYGMVKAIGGDFDMDFEPYQRGENPAVEDTIKREMAFLPSVRWNSVVTIVNKAPYAEDVEMNQGPDGKPIREENMLASYGGVAMIGYVEMKYSDKRLLKRIAMK